MPEVPPALPPKTKIMFSPSRHLFSPTDEIDDSSNDYASVQVHVDDVTDYRFDDVIIEWFFSSTFIVMLFSTKANTVHRSPASLRE